MPRHETLRFALGLAVVTLLAGPALAQIHPFESLGPADPLANGVSADQLDGQFHLFVTTEEGFYAWIPGTTTWDEYLQPDWIGVVRTAVVPVEGLPERRVLGGVNAFFKGTLWLSDDAGETQTLVRECDGGRVTDIDRSLVADPPFLVACTWSDVVDGELLRSDDGGASWTLLTGHGQHAMTAVEIVGDQEIYVAGDDQVARSLDGGATWEDLQGDLPGDEGVDCLRVPEPVTGLPGPAAEETARTDGVRDPTSTIILAGSDSGLWITGTADIVWQRALPWACRAVAERFVQVGVFSSWTEVWAVTWDGRLLYCIDLDWNDWRDVTAELAPAEPMDVAADASGVYVLTTDHGVFRTLGWDGLADAPPDAPTLAVDAAPNPFNPRTEVTYRLPVGGPAELTAHDLRGRSVARLASGRHAAGAHRTIWSPGPALASGAYLLRLETPAGTSVRKVLLAR
jgi:hypothetical protein